MIPSEIVNSDGSARRPLYVIKEVIPRPIHTIASAHLRKRREVDPIRSKIEKLDASQQVVYTAAYMIPKFHDTLGICAEEYLPTYV
mmetsp:Transcript_25007/g.51138  ORF Transcript_25007/g.51138 Transcript_25007/m.51138 type:complete len:86 (-) Transcript_25007:2047-2304(-)